MKVQQGFTLLELIIAVAIIGILSVIGIPAYTDYVTRGKLVDGTTQLADTRVKTEQFFQDNRTYVGMTCPAATKYFTFDCATIAPTTTTYTISATGRDNLIAYSYTIDQDNTKTSATPWGNGATCWIMKKGDSC